MNTAWSAAIGHGDRLLHLAQGGDAVGGGRLLDPLRLEGGQPADHADGLDDAPGAVRVEAKAAAADRFAHGRRVAQVGLLAAADLQVDHVVPGCGEPRRVAGQLFGACRPATKPK